MPMDRIDQKILALLQSDTTLPVAVVAERVGLSPSPCWRRIQKLEAEGFIRARVALLDAAKMNVGVTVFAAVRTNQHDVAWLEKFAKAVSDFPEVVEFYRMTGD